MNNINYAQYKICHSKSLLNMLIILFNNINDNRFKLKDILILNINNINKRETKLEEEAANLFYIKNIIKHYKIPKNNLKITNKYNDNELYLPLKITDAITIMFFVPTVDDDVYNSIINVYHNL